MPPRTIAELPFAELPIRTLLHLEEDRAEPSRAYAGFGWARIDRLWLAIGEADGTPVDDALVLALHSADDADALPDDVELEFELPDGEVAVLASTFLERWLPRLPPARAIVLALCNPHHARLRRPVALPAGATLHHGLGDVASWHEPDRGDRILLTAEAWCKVGA